VKSEPKINRKKGTLFGSAIKIHKLFRLPYEYYGIPLTTNARD
jgi:hypothetical protein